MLTLTATKRENTEDVSQLRKEGKMPAVFYGPGSSATVLEQSSVRGKQHATGQSKKTESTPITLIHKEFVKAWHTAGESSVVTLKSPEGSFDTLIHSVDYDPVTDIPRHADFYVFEKGKKLEISVPLEFVGSAPAVKDLGGSLIKVLHELKISAEPQNLPRGLQVDISSLIDFGSTIVASSIVLPTGVTLAESADQVVASAAAPKEEEVEEAPVDLSAIEVEKKGKKDEEGAEATGDTPKESPKKEQAK